MDNSPSRQRAEARAALRRLQNALQLELKRKGKNNCRYAAECAVAQKGRCPGIC